MGFPTATIQASYPAMVRISTPESGYMEMAVFSHKEGFEVPGPDVEDAPVAASLSSAGATRQYRYLSSAECLIEPICRVKAFSMTPLTWGGPETHVFRALVSEVARRWNKFHDGRGVYNVRSETAWNCGNMLTLSSFQPRRVSEKELAVWREKAQAVLSELFVVDGTLWRRCEEPCFVVSRGPRGMAVALRTPSDLFAAATSFCFGLSELDEADAWIDELAEKSGDARPSFELAVADWFRPKTSGASVDAVRIGRDVLDKVDGAGHKFGNAIPTEFVVAYGQLRQLVDAASSGVEPGMCDEIYAVIERLEAASDFAKGSPIPNKPSFALHRKRWENRAVSITGMVPTVRRHA